MGYKELAQKYQLPSFEEIDKEFDMTELSDSPFTLRSIRKKMIEKINYLKQFMEEVLQPDATLPGIVECKTFSDHQKDSLYTTYRKIMQITRKGIKAIALEDEETDAEFIKQTYQEWQQIKQEIANYSDVLVECWKKEETEEKDKYLG